jgi:uncharacterized protein (TIGR03000 family)
MNRFKPSWLRLLAGGLVLAVLPLAAGFVVAQTSQPAFVRVLLPPGADKATVMFGSHTTKQTGLDRRFVTPPLVPGKKFSYEVSAKWTEKGQEVSRSQKAYVSAGQTTTVDFTEPEEAKKDDTKKKDDDKDDTKKKDDSKKKDDTEIKTTAPKSRTFLFTYAATFNKLPQGKTVKIWIPLPKTTPEQEVTIVKEVLPGKGSVGVDPLYGNKILFIEATPEKDDSLAIALEFKVTRREVRTDAGTFRKPDSAEKIERFLKPDSKVPIDGKPLELIKDKKLGPNDLATAGVLYDVVNSHMKYSKAGKGWGNGDSVWACDSKFGNCTDFHSLFISLARSQKIPAKFEMGFPLPKNHGEGQIGGYHCWAWVLPDGKGWVPVDISEANRFPELRDFFFCNLCENRVAFTTGRDIDLVPRQSGPPLNYFIYPYAEVDGQPLPLEQIERRFEYRDLNTKP